MNVFNSQSTGVNFGLYYGLTENNTKLVLYNLSGKTMTFDLQNGTATAVGGEAPVPGKVLRQNGVYYVPAYAVCRYFGLSYSFYSTDYGPLLRLKDAGIRVTVNTDNMTVSGVTVREELQLMADTFGLGEQEIGQLLRNSADSAFLADADEKQRLKMKK